MLLYQLSKHPGIPSVMVGRHSSLFKLDTRDEWPTLILMREYAGLPFKAPQGGIVVSLRLQTQDNKTNYHP